MFSDATKSIFILRILILTASLISAALLTSSFHHAGFRYDFRDISTFRYVMGVTVTSLLYGVVQKLFAAYYALKHKRLIPLHFEFYADQVMGMLLATGSSAGIAVSTELKKAFVGLVPDDGGGGHRGGRDYDGDDDWSSGHHDMSPTESPLEEAAVEHKYGNLMDKFLAASVFLFMAWICMAIVSIISYNIKNETLSNYHRQSITLGEPSVTEPAQHTHVPTHHTDQDGRESSDGVCV